MPGAKPTDKDPNRPKKVSDPHPSTEEHYERQRHPGGAVDPDADTGPENADDDRLETTSSTSARKSMSSPRNSAGSSAAGNEATTARPDLKKRG